MQCVFYIPLHIRKPPRVALQHNIGLCWWEHGYFGKRIPDFIFQCIPRDRHRICKGIRHRRSIGFAQGESVVGDGVVFAPLNVCRRRHPPLLGEFAVGGFVIQGHKRWNERTRELPAKHLRRCIIRSIRVRARAQSKSCRQRCVRHNELRYTLCYIKSTHCNTSRR